MIKISDKGLQEYKADYLKEIKPKLIEGISHTDIKSKYEKKLKKLLLKNIDTFLIGSISDFAILFEEILNIYSLEYDDYLLFDFLYGTKISNKSNFEKYLAKYNTENVKILQKDIDLLLNMQNRRKYIESNFTQYYCYFMDRKDLKKIFDYEKLVGRRFLRNEILTKINIKVCPYCGRQFITSYNKENTLKSTAALDHFYPKSKYPFFALSLFNFIPACNTCNSLMKLSKDFYVNKHLYPYEEGFEEDAEFVIEGSKLITDYIRKDKDTTIDEEITIDIKMNTDDPEKVTKIENNIKTFMLKEVYQIHGDVVKDLLYRLQVYRPQYIEEISNLMKLNKETVEILAFGKPDEKDILGKLKADILNQYKD